MIFFVCDKILIKKKMIQHVITISKKFTFAYNLKEIDNDAHKIIDHRSRGFHGVLRHA